MSTSGDPTSSNYGALYAGGPTTTAHYQIGDTGFGTEAPGIVSPWDVNPYASRNLTNTENLYSQLQNSAAGGAFNDDFYRQMQSNQEANLTTSLGNQYAARGLSGSSAELGGLNQAIQTNQMNWLNRQQSDQMRAIQGLSGLNQQGYNETMGIQNQYGNYEDVNNQNVMNLLGLSQQEQAANQQMWGGIIGSGLGAAGQAAASAKPK